jgi:hypothetical protein
MAMLAAVAVCVWLMLTVPAATCAPVGNWLTAGGVMSGGAAKDAPVPTAPPAMSAAAVTKRRALFLPRALTCSATATQVLRISL